MANDYHKPNGETHPDRAVIFQQKGKITYINQKARHLFGLNNLSADCSFGLNAILEVAGRSNLENMLSGFEQGGQNRISGTAKIRTHNRDRSDISLSVSRRHDLGPDTLHIIAENKEKSNSRDQVVNARNRLEFERFYKRLNRPIMIFDVNIDDPRLVYINPAAAEYIGFDPDALVGLRLRDIFPNLGLTGSFKTILESSSSQNKSIQIDSVPDAGKITLSFSSIDDEHILIEIESHPHSREKRFARSYQDDLFRQLSDSHKSK